MLISLSSLSLPTQATATAPPTLKQLATDAYYDGDGFHLGDDSYLFSIRELMLRNIKCASSVKYSKWFKLISSLPSTCNHMENSNCTNFLNDFFKQDGYFSKVLQILKVMSSPENDSVLKSHALTVLEEINKHLGSDAESSFVGNNSYATQDCQALCKKITTHIFPLLSYFSEKQIRRVRVSL